MYKDDNGGSGQTQMILDIIKKYQAAGGSGGEKLLDDIYESVAKEKAAGRLNNEQILNFVKNVSPLLNQSQKAKLSGLVEKLLKV